MNFNLSQELKLSCKYNNISYQIKKQERILDNFSPNHPGATWNPEEWFRITLTKAELKDRKSTRLNSSHSDRSRMPSSA